MFDASFFVVPETGADDTRSIAHRHTDRSLCQLRLHYVPEVRLPITSCQLPFTNTSPL